MLVLKKINNNVAICRDGNQRELVAFGKGIGFPTTPYELTDLRKIERTFYDIGNQYLSLLNEIPYEIIQFTARQLLKAQDSLSYDTNANLTLTLADHIAFAIERAQKGIYVHMPSVYEVEMNYPKEVEIGRQFVAAIKEELNVKLPKNEVQGVAMHLINACGNTFSGKIPSFSEEHFEEILQQTTGMIEQKLGIQVQQDTFYYRRFAKHFQYLLDRVYNHGQIDSSNVQIYAQFREQFADISDCVNCISDYCQQTWSLELSEEEKLYLILHINCICNRET